MRSERVPWLPGEILRAHREMCGPKTCKTACPRAWWGLGCSGTLRGGAGGGVDLLSSGNPGCVDLKLEFSVFEIKAPAFLGLFSSVEVCRGVSRLRACGSSRAQR